ncbi:MAG: MarR family transcriptional regulator [Parasutterella excrementihominis]
MIGLASHAAFLPVIFKHPACRTGEFSSIFTTRRQVASHILNDLARAGILERVEDGRDRVFYHTRLIELLESENYSFSPLPASIDPFVPLYQKGTPGRTNESRFRHARKRSQNSPLPAINSIRNF